MKTELDEALVRDFPNLYRDRNAPRHNKYTQMNYGFDVSNGWEPLLRRLSQKLEALILQLPEEERHAYRAVQVKSKFAGLRFYLSAETPEMTKAIREAENESDHTCENCGKPGTTASSHGGWLRVECNTCSLLK